jgi:hypothetical protein
MYRDGNLTSHRLYGQLSRFIPEPKQEVMMGTKTTEGVAPTCRTWDHHPYSYYTRLALPPVSQWYRVASNCIQESPRGPLLWRGQIKRERG